jgi:hypothetical protein
LDNLVHLRAGKDVGKLIHDLYKDIEIQSAFLSETCPPNM